MPGAGCAGHVGSQLVFDLPIRVGEAFVLTKMSPSRGPALELDETGADHHWRCGNVRFLDKGAAIRKGARAVHMCPACAS
jgi:hypothetical protein